MRNRPRLAVGIIMFATLLISASLAATSSAQSSDSPAGEVLRKSRSVEALLGSRAQRIGTSAGPDPDTVYVGKSYANHTAPDNYWNLYTGSYRPGTNSPGNTVWDWDNSVGLQAPDSLQGWWPTRENYIFTGGLTVTDDQRPWWALDHGNIGNYVISQGAAAKRTFGVVGYWHADPGNAAGTAMMWSPISGTKSAWCGLRQHGDNSVVDQVTANPFNQDVVEFLARGGTVGGGSSQRFPGYVDQADQILYRDIAM